MEILVDKIYYNHAGRNVLLLQQPGGTGTCGLCRLGTYVLQGLPALLCPSSFFPSSFSPSLFVCVESIITCQAHMD